MRLMISIKDLLSLSKCKGMLVTLFEAHHDDHGNENVIKQKVK